MRRMLLSSVILMRCIVGIDSGGTKTDVIVTDLTGKLLSWGSCSIFDPHSGRGKGGGGRSERTVSSAIRQAFADITQLEELYVSGTIANFPFWRFSLNGPVQYQIFPVGEPHAAMAQADVEFGVVALAGTGALVYGKSRDGRQRHLDGLGPMLGDYGAGYQIGAMAVKAVAKSRWHPRHRTSLFDPIFELCGGHEHDERGHSLLGYFNADRDRAEIASFARIVDEQANAGDGVSIQILRDAATALGETVRDAMSLMDMLEEEYPLVATGSVITSSELYWQFFREFILSFAPYTRFIRSDLPPVLGMTLPALYRVGTLEKSLLRENLLNSTREYLHSKKTEMVTG